MKITTRLMLDSGVIIAVLSLSFWAGVQSQKIRNLEIADSARGGTAISVEADNRLTKLESKIEILEQRIITLE